MAATKGCSSPLAAGRQGIGVFEIVSRERRQGCSPTWGKLLGPLSSGVQLSSCRGAVQPAVRSMQGAGPLARSCSLCAPWQSCLTLVWMFPCLGPAGIDPLDHPGALHRPRAALLQD